MTASLWPFEFHPTICGGGDGGGDTEVRPRENIESHLKETVSESNSTSCRLVTD